MATQKLRHFLAFLDSEVIPEILFERVKRVGSTWGPDGDLVRNKSILAPRWLCDVPREDYDQCLRELSTLSSRRLQRKDVRAHDIEATLFDILFTVIQAYPEPYTKILWNDDEAELWPLVESTCLPFLAVLSTFDIESHVSAKTKLIYLIPFIKFMHRILVILKSSSPPSISILAKHALHLLSNDESHEGGSLEIHILQVVDELIHLLVKQGTESWSQLERLYRAEVNGNAVASMEFTIAGFYAHQPALLHRLVKSLKMAGFPRDQKWSPKQILARTQLVGASVALEAAGSSWSTLPITVQVLSAIQAIRDREFIFASRILRSVMDMDQFREKCWPHSHLAIVLGTQLVRCYNATAREKNGALFAEELMKHIWHKQRIPSPPNESVVSLARSRGDLQFFLAYTDSLIGSGDFRRAKPFLACLTRHEAASNTLRLLSILRILKINRRETHVLHLDSWNWLEEAIDFLESAPSSVLYQYLEEVTCILSTVDRVDTTQIARAKDIIDALEKVDITRFDGPETMKLALQEYKQELQVYREDLGLFSITGPQLYYCRNIREGFPKASIAFIERIGAAIWERFQRLKGMPVLEETFESPVVTKEPSKFHDSGIGSSLQSTDALPLSIPPARSRASKLSFNNTFDPSSAPLLDIPAEILAGKPYNCEWCGRDLKMEHPKRQWPQHVFADLRPYICIMEDCKVKAAFGSQIEYEQHLATHEFINVLACEICNHVENDIHHLHQHCQSAHRAEIITAKGKPKRILRNLNTQQCPFCRETPGAKNFVRHVSRHCEEVALSSLWQALDEDSESVDSDEHSKISLLSLRFDDANQLTGDVLDVPEPLTEENFIGTSPINTAAHNNVRHEAFQTDDNTVPQASFFQSQQAKAGPSHLRQRDDMILERQESPVRRPVTQKPTSKKLSERFDQDLIKTPRKDGHSLIPRFAKGKRKETKISTLAKHFEQLSREFEAERLRDRKARAAKVEQSRLFPRTSSKPIVEVYKDIDEAVEERGPSDEDLLAV